jgi:hypothetical protein
MAENVLKAIIKIEAPGVEQTTNKVAKSADGMAVSLQKIVPPASSATRQLSLLEKQVAAFGGGASRFNSSFVPQINNGVTALRRLPRAANEATQSMINLGRVVQDAPFGFLGIANNLNPLIESFGRTSKAAGGFRGAMKAMAGSLLGAGGLSLAVSAISTGLILFGDKLFGTSKKVKENDEALKAFNRTLEESKSRVDKLGESLQFLNSLSTLNIKISGLPELLDLQGQYVAIQGELVKAVEETEIASRNAIKARIDNEIKGTEETKKTFEEAESIFKNAFKKRTDLEEKSRLTSRQIALQKVNDAKDAKEKEKKLRDEQLAEYEKWVSETISKGKELAKFFEGRRVLPAFTIFDNRDDELKKAQQIIREFEQGGAESIFRVQTTIEPIFPPNAEIDFIEQVRERAKAISDSFNEGTGLQNLKLEIPTFITSKKTQNEQAALKEVTQRIQEATFAANAMGSAFSSAFDSLVKGENALQAIGNALKQLVADLIKATIQALIFRAVTNLLVPGAGAAGGAAAGAAGIGRLFGGGVAGLSGNSGFSGGITVAVQGELVGRGGSLVGVVTRAGATNGRSFVG